MTASKNPTPSRYQWTFKGVTFDFYRLCEILGIESHPQAHALKKVIRAGLSIKPIEQDIDEAIDCLMRWKEIIREDRGCDGVKVRAVQELTEEIERRPRILGQDLHRRLAAAKSAMPSLIKKWRWDLADVFRDSPTRPSTTCDDPRVFLAALFNNPKSLLWTGEVFQSGEKRRERWRTTEGWFSSHLDHIGPMTTPSTWKAKTTSRTRTNIETAPYVVLAFNGPKGWTPRDQADLDRHIDESLAITRRLKDDRHWNLAAIVHTGNKSLHCWFDHPGETILDGFRETLPVLGIDPSLIGHPEHPVRLPGQVHDKSGNKSRVLYLR